MSNATDRDALLTADDAALLAACTIDIYRSGGPGGQKRNKTSSAVQLRHAATGLTVIAEESRSQAENKRRAARRLRMAMAIAYRAAIEKPWTPPAWLTERIDRSGRLAIAPRHESFPLAVAIVLDVFDACGGRLQEASALVGLSSSALAKFLRSERHVLAQANAIRRAANLHALT